MSTTRENRDTARRPPRVQGPLLVWLPLLCAVGCVGGLLVVLMFGQVRGVEFSPQTFARRSYFFFQIPLVRWQITPSWRADETLPLERHLQQQRLLPHRAAAARWDVVWASESGRHRDGNPIILTRYLDIPSSGSKQTWYTWTVEHPKHAKVLWRAVQQAAVLDAYELVPALFELAETDLTPEELDRRVNQRLNQDLAELAKDLAAAGKVPAAERVKTALSDGAKAESPLPGPK